MGRARRRRVIAFTMIEVLLAISIFSMVMVAIYSCWSAIMKGSRSGLMAAAEVQRTRITVRALEQALGSAVVYADNMRYYAFLADTGGGPFTWLSFVARLPESFPGSGLFQGQEVRRVSFEVSKEGTLLLRQSPLLEYREPGQEPYTIKLAPNVSAFAMEFFDVRKNEWIPEWNYTNQLPRLCRVALAFGKDAGGQPANLLIRTIQMGSTMIARISPGGVAQPGALAPGGAGLAPGAIPQANPDLPPWSLSLPDGFDNRRGGDRSSIFPQ